jgi:uncharacterized protein (DUF1810 family)
LESGHRLPTSIRAAHRHLTDQAKGRHTRLMDTAAKFASFVTAQDGAYDQVIRELTAGRKETHWMWFGFPQLAGLGSSLLAQKFAIASAAEAREYMNHPVLGPRLRECTRLVLRHAGAQINSILGYPDDLKFRSCLTLFTSAAPDEPLFGEALQTFYSGERDPRTIALLSSSSQSG